MTHIGNFDYDNQIPQRCSYGKVLCIFFAAGSDSELLLMIRLAAII